MERLGRSFTMVMWCSGALYQRGLYDKMVDGKACALTAKYSSVKVYVQLNKECYL
jgi:hypothetical protein